MGLKKSKMLSLLFRKRRLIQIGSLIFLIVIPLLNLLNLEVVTGNYYSLRIWKIEFVDPLFALQHLLLTLKFNWQLLMGISIPLLIAFLGGKLFCSFICPYNLLAEWLQKILPAKKTNVFKVNAKRYWAVLIGWIILTVIAGFPILYFVSMPGQIGVFLGDLIFLKVMGVESLMILAVLGIDVVFLKRIWCRELCPVGALLQRFHWNYGLKINYNEIDCVCSTDEIDSPCVQRCPVYLNPKSDPLYPACFNCGECVKECYYYGEALKLKFIKDITNFEPNFKQRKEEQTINKEEA